MKTVTPIVATNNALGLAAAAILLAFRNPSLGNRKFIAQEIKDDPHHGDHIALMVEEEDLDELPGTMKIGTRSVIIHPIPSSSNDMLKHMVEFTNFNVADGKNHYAIMNVRMLVVAAIEYLTTGEVLEGPEN